MEPELAARRREEILTASRGQYATPLADVEAAMSAARPSGEVESRDTKTRIRLEVPLPAPKPAPAHIEETLPPAQTAGRGGDHHKYLQQLIKRWAEGRGYEVTVEKPILDGLGWVDVALRRGERSLACEISVSTAADHELGNVQKCLAAGFNEVLLISSEKSLLTTVKHAAIAALAAQQYKLVKFLTPEQVFAYIESQEATAEGRPAAVDPNEIMTAKEVEELLRIDVKTVYSYVQKGLLPYVKMQSNVRFIRSEILKWMDERQFKPGSRSRK